MSIAGLLRGGIVTIGVALSAVPGFAESPNFDWAGPYVGVQAGAAAPAFSATGTISVTGSGYLLSGLNGTRSGSTTKTFGGSQAGVAGIYGGYNFQTPAGVVFGGEADFNWTGLAGTSAPLLQLGNCPDLLCLNLAAITSQVDWYGTVRGTLGQSIGRLLIYGTGGLAYGQVASSRSRSVRVLSTDFPLVTSSVSDVRYGWTFGMGAAIAVTDRISVRLDYSHVDLGDGAIFVAATPINPPGPGSSTITTTIVDRVAFDVVRAGLTLALP